MQGGGVCHAGVRWVMQGCGGVGHVEEFTLNFL